MTKTTKIVIALLVLMNLVLATFLFLGRPNRGNHKMPKDIIIEKLDLDENQIKEYEVLISVHREKAMSLQQEIATLKTGLYQGIDNKSVANDSIISLIGEKFEQLEKAHQSHFLGIKSLCKDDQKEKYKELSTQFQKIFAPKGRRSKRGKR